MKENKLKEGDKIIWDSHFGYEIGYYVSDEGVMYNTCLVKLVTGICPGVNNSLTKHEIIPYNRENLTEMVTKYNQVKSYRHK